MDDWAAFAIARSRVQDKTMSLRTITSPYASMSANAWRTEVDVSGSGYLHQVQVYAEMSSLAWELRITVDGGTPVTVRVTDFGKMRFITSLKVEVHNTYGSTQRVVTATTLSLV